MICPMEKLRETLVAKLRERGITYLAPSDAVASEEIASDDALLIALLRQSREPELKMGRGWSQAEIKKIRANPENPRPNSHALLSTPTRASTPQTL